VGDVIFVYNYDIISTTCNTTQITKKSCHLHTSHKNKIKNYAKGYKKLKLSLYCLHAKKLDNTVFFYC
jgi:hypothetical protein